MGQNVNLIHCSSFSILWLVAKPLPFACEVGSGNQELLIRFSGVICQKGRGYAAIHRIIVPLTFLILPRIILLINVRRLENKKSVHLSSVIVCPR